MKSAYELAMERLEKESGPTVSLNAEQKAQYAEVSKIFEAKIAEARIVKEKEIELASQAGNAPLAEELHNQLAKDIQQLELEKTAKLNNLLGQSSA